MHYWGDKDFDWESLDKAIYFIDKNLVFGKNKCASIKRKIYSLACKK